MLRIYHVSVYVLDNMATCFTKDKKFEQQSSTLLVVPDSFNPFCSAAVLGDSLLPELALELSCSSSSKNSCSTSFLTGEKSFLLFSCFSSILDQFTAFSARLPLMSQENKNLSIFFSGARAGGHGRKPMCSIRRHTLRILVKYSKSFYSVQLTTCFWTL